MISSHRRSDASSLVDLKAQHLQSLTAPLDGMWEVGFIDPAPHWEIQVEGRQAGYYAANDEGTLLQFYVCPAFETQAWALFEHVIGKDELTQATVGTNDPSYLSLCLDAQKTVTVHTYLYELNSKIPHNRPPADNVVFRLAEASELDRVIAFQQACLGRDEDLSDWLRGYSSNLIARKELFILHLDEEWLGAGECRNSDTQKGIADLGMMVAPAHRGKGWATYILTLLSSQSRAQGRHAICSTTVGNVGAQKAIARAGFISRHRILNVSF